MRDKISLQVGDNRMENFLSYRVTSNLFEAADGFSLELANPEHEITEGALCKLYVNDMLELNGIVDRITERGDKENRSLAIEGRDLMGIIVDAYAEDYQEKEGETLEELANRLLAPIKQINRQDIIYGAGSRDKAVPITDYREEYEFTEVDPEQTIFEILKRYATARGLLFYSLPDGTFVFGRPVASGTADYRLVNCRDGRENNVIEWERTRDVSGRYSKYTVIADRQGTDDMEAGATHATKSVTDDTFPSHLYKPFVARIAHDGDRPEKYARLLMEKGQFDGFSLRYKTFGHSQAGKSWQVNAICHVRDDVLKIDGDFLIYGRTFEMSRQGVFTSLNLSKLGIMTV